MKITNIAIRKTENKEDKCRAYVTVILDDVLAIHNIRLLEGNKGLFVAMPSRKSGDNQYFDLVHPIVNTFREELNNAIINEFNK